ncbi:MAG TPA: DUF6603 domain-containing protein, partial [Pyrinomonadaceae bacterium]|nr:DUF6603 domain-containing protein [Pyrinomonadaceae bacterium]
KFTDSFDGLDRFPFNKLVTSGAHFVYSTVAQTEFALPSKASTSLDLAAGLNLLSNVTFTGVPAVLKLLKPIIGEASLSLKMWGPFGPAKDDKLPVGKLRGPLTSYKEFGIGVDPFELKLSKPAIAVQIGKTTDDVPVTQIDLLVEAEFQQKLNVAIAIPATGGPVEVSVKPLPNYPAIDALVGSLPGGKVFTDFKTHLPSELTSVIKDIALDNFALRAAVDPPAVSYIGLSVTTTNPWTIISDVLVLQHLRLDIQTVEPSKFNLTQVQLEARAEFLPQKKIFPGEFDFVVEIEKETSWKVQTISGSYHGAVNLGTLVSKLIGSSVPSALERIQFSDFGVAVNREADRYNYSFYGSAAASFAILDRDFTSALTVAVKKTASGHDVNLAGNLVVGEQVFSLSLKLGESNSNLEAKWQNHGKPFGFNELASAFGWDSMPELPEGLDLALKEARFTYDFADKTVTLTAKSANYGQIVFASLSLEDKRVYLFSLDIPLDLKFSTAPLVGESLRLDPPVGVDELQINVASADLTDKHVTELNTYFERPLIPKSLAKGVTIGANIQMSGKHEIVLPLTSGARKEQLLLTGADQSALTTSTNNNYQAEPKWFTLKKTLGPVHFDKVGVQYQDATLRFLLNAAFTAAGLTLSVDGLTVGSSLKKFKPEFDLRGLGIEYKAGDVEIGGAFLRTGPKGSESYNGAAVIKTKQVALSALGSYARVNGEPSLFIYAFLDYPLGGPTFFFVTGLAAGFGYNRKLIPPSIDNVAEFPLVKQAIKGRDAAPANVMDALEKLRTYVPPSSGSIFLAIGVKFNSFKLIDSFALLTMEFGDKLAINLIGLSTATVPTPEAGKTVTPLAQVQIAWKATFDPDEGCLAIDARLTPNSYILSKDCRLTGGYAFYSWFSGPHAGDFVQTLGGYHPEFKIPDHYPRVPRLAFDWRVSNSLTIQGDAYYALTGSALMAGGHLEVLYRQGELRAWLKVGADFLIAWKPYHYSARLYVNVGASYTFNINLLFARIRCTISVDVGASLHLWGPDFSGTARIDLSVISFTIAFGAGASQTPQPLKEWSSFQQSFLPAKNVCSIAVKDGLVRNIGSGEQERWVINPKEFALVVDSAVPFKTTPLKNAAGKTLVDGANVDFGVGPMAVTKDRLTSNLTITVKRGTTTVEGFRYSVIKKKVPAGLWGESASPKVNGDGFLDGVPSGVEIAPGEQPAAGKTNIVEVKKLNIGETPHQKRNTWGPAISFVSADIKDAQARRDAIGSTIESNSARDALLKTVGIDIKVKKTLAADFVNAPQIGKLYVK